MAGEAGSVMNWIGTAQAKENGGRAVNGNGGRASGPVSLSATQAEELDRACDRFEAAWRLGEQPRIEHHLSATEGPLTAALVVS